MNDRHIVGRLRKMGHEVEREAGHDNRGIPRPSPVANALYEAGEVIERLYLTSGELEESEPELLTKCPFCAYVVDLNPTHEYVVDDDAIPYLIDHAIDNHIAEAHT